MTVARIYVLFYKNGTIVKNDDLYTPLMAGNHRTKNKTGISGDNTADNISEKNKYYSELTGHYWIWKNTEQEIVGTCHYRRFFAGRNEPIIYRIKRLFYYPVGLYKKRAGLIYTSRVNFWEKRILGKDQLLNLLEKYDAILPQPRILRYSVKEHYRRYHNLDDLKLLEAIIREKHPEYLQALNDVMESNQLYANNMFILKNQHFQEFMSWLFDILFEFEKRAVLSDYAGYQERVLGFIAERLLNVWFRKKSMNCLELKVVYFKNLKFE